MCEICETEGLALVEDQGGGVRACATTVPLIKLHLRGFVGWGFWWLMLLRMCIWRI
jgi:hypothetical protein